MAPRKTARPPYTCPLLMSEDDVRAMRAMSGAVAEIATMLRDVKEITVDNHHTLRGHNGDNDGLIARFTVMEERLDETIAALGALKGVPADLASVTSKVDALKDVPEAVATWKRYPPLTWLVVHKFKEFAIITISAVVVTITFGFPNSYSGEQLRQLIELIVAKWLRL